MINFDQQFALSTTLPLAEAAYDIADGQSPLLPSGFTLVGPIAIDLGKAKAFMAVTSLAQQRMQRAFLDEGLIGGLVARNDQTKTLAVAFRGTRTPSDWLKDFEFLATPYLPVPNWGLVHQGFQLVYLAMQASVRSLVTSALGDATDLWIVGHSLGGAASVLCAPDLAHNVVGIIPKLHTYAGPRAGQPSFDEQFDQFIANCSRLVNRWDIVPQLPPPAAQYQHVGEEIHIDGGFTLDLARAHSLELSYRPGINHLNAANDLAKTA